MRDGEPLDREKLPYSKLVESMLYLTVCTWADIAQAVGVLARYMSAPTKAHQRVRYLTVTAMRGLTMGVGAWS
jgi:hypothetical protein